MYNVDNIIYHDIMKDGGMGLSNDVLNQAAYKVMESTLNNVFTGINGEDALRKLSKLNITKTDLNAIKYIIDELQINSYKDLINFCFRAYVEVVSSAFDTMSSISDDLLIPVLSSLDELKRKMVSISHETEQNKYKRLEGCFDKACDAYSELLRRTNKYVREIESIDGKPRIEFFVYVNFNKKGLINLIKRTEISFESVFDSLNLISIIGNTLKWKNKNIYFDNYFDDLDEFIDDMIDHKYISLLNAYSYDNKDFWCSSKLKEKVLLIKKSQDDLSTFFNTMSSMEVDFENDINWDAV